MATMKSLNEMNGHELRALTLGEYLALAGLECPGAADYQEVRGCQGVPGEIFFSLTTPILRRDVEAERFEDGPSRPETLILIQRFTGGEPVAEIVAGPLETKRARRGSAAKALAGMGPRYAVSACGPATP